MKEKTVSETDEIFRANRARVALPKVSDVGANYKQPTNQPTDQPTLMSRRRTGREHVFVFRKSKSPKTLGT